MNRYLIPTKVLLTADAELESAGGLRLLLGDTQYGDVEVTLPEYDDAEGLIEATKTRALNTFSVDLNGSTVNSGVSGPIEMEGLGDSILLIPGSATCGEWILFEPIVL